jgi:putative ABC transport system permease protein
MIAVGNDIGDKINQELRSLGANLVVTPLEDTLDVNIGGVNLKPASEGAYINEQDLIKIKSIFWGHNIKGYAPFLSDRRKIQTRNGEIDAELIGTYFAQPLRYGKEEFTTGVRTVNPWWKVEGAWPQDYGDFPEQLPPDVLAGSKLAQQAGLNIGDQIQIGGHKLRISGILNSGGDEDQAIIAPLHVAQTIRQRSHQAGRCVRPQRS